MHTSSFSPSFCLTVLVDQQAGLTAMSRPNAALWNGRREREQCISTIAGIAPLFGFTALALGLVGYVTTIFKLSALFTILWAKLFLGEGQIRERLLGATVMMGGGRHGGCLRTPPLMKNRKDGTRQIFSPRVSFHLMKEYSSLWYFRHSKAFPRFQTKRYASGNDLFLFSVFCRIPGKTGNTGAEKLRGRTHPMTHDVYLLYRLFKDSSTKSYGEEKPNRYSTNNTQLSATFETIGTIISYR